jgi:hypothetical protein
MSTARILNPPRTVDPYSHQAERMAEMERRLALLEGAANARVQRFRRVLSTATNVNLLNFDGDSFTGIRISFVGAINGAGVGVAAPLIRLKPNGLTSLPTQSVVPEVLHADAVVHADYGCCLRRRVRDHGRNPDLPEVVERQQRN